MEEYYKPCKCSNITEEITTINNIEESITAFFAQHPQFTNHAQIDWQGLGLVDSDLHKEYEYLNTLPGYSVNDMSKFCIDHIYPATIKEALESDSPSIVANKYDQPDPATHCIAAPCPC